MEDGADTEEGGGLRDDNGMRVGKGGGRAWPTRPHLARGLHPRAVIFGHKRGNGRSADGEATIFSVAGRGQ